MPGEPEPPRWLTILLVAVAVVVGTLEMCAREGGLPRPSGYRRAM